MRKINKIIIHCSDSDFGNALIINDWHKERGWDCIGYHYIVGNGHYDDFADGNIEYGRDLAISGAHAKGHNFDSIGICLIGKPIKGRCKFTLKQLQTARTLCIELSKRYDIGAVVGHFEINNQKTCPSMDMGLFRAYIASGDSASLSALLKDLYEV